MNTWKFALIAAGISGMTLGMSAQKVIPDLPRETIQREKIETFRIAYYTERLNLTPEEAQKFWPVYNAYKKNMDQKIRKERPHHAEMPDYAALSDNDAAVLVDAEIRQVQEISTLTQKFYTDLKQILAPQKILLFIEADRSFKRVLLKKLEDYRSHEKR